VLSTYQVGNEHQPGSLTASRQKFRIQYQYESLLPYILDPHRQTMIDMEYFARPPKGKGDDIVLFVDASEGVEHRSQPQGHKVAVKKGNGLHVDVKIDGSL
jgi:hypothetical protein